MCFPHIAQHADKLAVIRSCHHDGFTHTAALNWLNNGWPRLGRPSVGSWVIYGLGSASENLPAFVVMLDGGIKSGPPVYGPDFFPAAYQGTVLRNGPAPILNVKPPDARTESKQKDMRQLLQWYNQQHLEPLRTITTWPRASLRTSLRSRCKWLRLNWPTSRRRHPQRRLYMG